MMPMRPPALLAAPLSRLAVVLPRTATATCSARNSDRAPRAADRPTPKLAFAVGLAFVLSLAGCGGQSPPPPTPDEVRARIRALLPVSIPDRSGWAADIYAAFAALGIEPSTENICSALAVTEQESTFNQDPPVAGLGGIARKEIERRAERLGVPQFMVRAAMQLESRDGRTWEQRLAAARTEKELSIIFEELIDAVPLGRRLLANANPVRTGGPMQVSIAWSEAHAKRTPYPYPVEGSIRNEVFTRRGGMYFGIAHLLDYPASYDKPLYRYADFNAGHYASRNAAFQKAVSEASGIPLALDGDLIRHGAGRDHVGTTEVAVRALADRLDMSHAQIRRALEKSRGHSFEETALYERVFEVADGVAGRPLPRAVMPEIRLQSPKITRKLTTEWFATRVERRHRSCMERARALDS